MLPAPALLASSLSVSPVVLLLLFSASTLIEDKRACVCVCVCVCVLWEVEVCG
jgi:hypothetical protein